MWEINEQLKAYMIYSQLSKKININSFKKSESSMWVRVIEDFDERDGRFGFEQENWNK